jgi:hypothetical protein
MERIMQFKVGGVYNWGPKLGAHDLYFKDFFVQFKVLKIDPIWVKFKVLRINSSSENLGWVTGTVTERIIAGVQKENIREVKNGFIKALLKWKELTFQVGSAVLSG